MRPGPPWVTLEKPPGAFINSIFDYLDYRKFLKDYYLERKSENPRFSYRLIALKVGFKSPGHFTQIIQGKADISFRLAFKFAQFMKLKKREADYFDLLVRFDQAKANEEKRLYLERLSAFSESKVKLLTEQQHRFFDKWYYMAVREILSFFPFNGEYAALAAKVEPPIREAEAREAIEVLESLGLIRRNASGSYERIDPVMSTGYDAASASLRKFQADTMDLAKEAMERLPRDKRSISTLTLSLSDEAYKSIEEELKAFRRKLLAIAKNEERVDRVIQFNFQIFPLSKT